MKEGNNALIIKSLSELQDFSSDILESLSLGSEATTLALSGDLGAGKTAFVKSLAKNLGVEEVVNSPTFVIEKIYKLQNQKFEHLIHIDAYRIEDEKEMLVLGFKEIINNPKNIIAIEWPEKIKGLIPENVIKINFEFIDEQTRKISW